MSGCKNQTGTAETQLTSLGGVEANTDRNNSNDETACELPTDGRQTSVAKTTDMAACVQFRAPLDQDSEDDFPSSSLAELEEKLQQPYFDSRTKCLIGEVLSAYKSRVMRKHLMYQAMRKKATTLAQDAENSWDQMVKAQNIYKRLEEEVLQLRLHLKMEMLKLEATAGEGQPSTSQRASLSKIDPRNPCESALRNIKETVNKLRAEVRHNRNEIYIAKRENNRLTARLQKVEEELQQKDVHYQKKVTNMAVDDCVTKALLVCEREQKDGELYLAVKALCEMLQGSNKQKTEFEKLSIDLDAEVCKLRSERERSQQEACCMENEKKDLIGQLEKAERELGQNALRLASRKAELEKCLTINEQMQNEKDEDAQTISSLSREVATFKRKSKEWEDEFFKACIEILEKDVTIEQTQEELELTQSKMKQLQTALQKEGEKSQHKIAELQTALEHEIAKAAKISAKRDARLERLLETVSMHEEENKQAMADVRQSVTNLLDTLQSITANN